MIITKLTLSATALGVLGLAVTSDARKSAMTSSLPTIEGDTVFAPTSQARGMSAGLLRRLAAAVDGYRTGLPVWVVASETHPYPVLGVFPSRAEADRAQGAAPRGFAVHGPYVTPMDFDRRLVFVAKQHFNPTRWGEDDRWKLPERPWLVEDIDSVTITAYHHSGRTWRLASPGLEMDAIFFTLPAHDKFVFPYYAELSGLDVAKGMRDSLATYMRRPPQPRDR